MATGACGINCDVCGLRARGVCTGCRAGTESASAGTSDPSCPILECATKRGIGYCLRDCPEFPCGIMEQRGSPFSAHYLGMHRCKLGLGTRFMH